MTSYSRRILIGAALVMMATVVVGLSVTAENGWIAGTVSDNSLYPFMGNAISGATVSVVGGNQTTTDVNGSYNITVPEGTYNLTVTKTGYNDKTVSQITVTANNTTMVKIVLTKPSGNLTGTVKDQYGDAQIMAKVALDANNSAYADTSGKYTITGLPVGTFTFTVTTLDDITTTFSATITNGQNTTKDVVVNIPTSVTVIVVGGDIIPLPIEGATVTLGTQTGTTDALGSVTFNNCTPGNTTLTVKMKDYKMVTKAETIDKGGDIFTVSLGTKGGMAAAAAALFGFAVGICLVIILIPLIILILIIWLIIRWLRKKKVQTAPAPQPGAPPAPPQGQQPPGAPPAPPQAPPQS